MQQVLRAAGASIADAQARSDDWALRGNGIELKEAAALEKRLVGNPHDLEARITLLVFENRGLVRCLRLAELEKQVIGLPLPDRAKLIASLMALLDTADEGGVEAAWEQEVKERSAAYHAGKVKAVPVSEAAARARRGLRERYNSSHD